MVNVIDGQLYTLMLSRGVESLANHRTVVNDLNVFPVPDGDTGDNMYMTIYSGFSALNSTENSSVGRISETAAQGMLLGARGNSGVILSRMFAGISQALADTEKADIPTLKKAFKKAVEESHNAVSEPVEGTMLTVLRDAVNYADTMPEDCSLNDYFTALCNEAKNALDRTPDQLTVLRDAGVVDSGGAGLVYIFEGMLNAVSDGKGGEVFRQLDSAQNNHPLNINAFSEDSELEFGYCTEFLLRLQTKKVGSLCDFNEKSFVDHLKKSGESVVAFRDGSIIKVHIHTMTPGEILSYAQNFGEFLTLKIENMMLQNSEVEIKDAYSKPKKKKPHKKYGTVSVAFGDGIKEAFKNMGIDEVIDGGQTMNPSSEDFLNAFKEINADTIIVFPNNSNIIMTAEQAASMYNDADVRIIPTNTIGQGYASMSMMDTSMENVDELCDMLKSESEGVVTGMVSMAVRTTDMYSVSIEAGNFIGYVNGDILATDSDAGRTCIELADKLEAGDFDVALFIYGKDISQDDATATMNELVKKYPLTEFIMIDGGQPVYEYILILE